MHGPTQSITPQNRFEERYWASTRAKVKINTIIILYKWEFAKIAKIANLKSHYHLICKIYNIQKEMCYELFFFLNSFVIECNFLYININKNQTKNDRPK